VVAIERSEVSNPATTNCPTETRTAVTRNETTPGCLVRFRTKYFHCGWVSFSTKRVQLWLGFHVWPHRWKFDKCFKTKHSTVTTL